MNAVINVAPILNLSYFPTNAAWTQIFFFQNENEFLRLPFQLEYFKNLLFYTWKKKP